LEILKDPYNVNLNSLPESQKDTLEVALLESISLIKEASLGDSYKTFIAYLNHFNFSLLGTEISKFLLNEKAKINLPESSFWKYHYFGIWQNELHTLMSKNELNRYMKFWFSPNDLFFIVTSEKNWSSDLEKSILKVMKNEKFPTSFGEHFFVNLMCKKPAYRKVFKDYLPSNCFSFRRNYYKSILKNKASGELFKTYALLKLLEMGDLEEAYL